MRDDMWRYFTPFAGYVGTKYLPILASGLQHMYYQQTPKYRISNTAQRKRNEVTIVVVGFTPGSHLALTREGRIIPANKITACMCHRFIITYLASQSMVTWPLMEFARLAQAPGHPMLNRIAQSGLGSSLPLNWSICTAEKSFYCKISYRPINSA